MKSMTTIFRLLFVITLLIFSGVIASAQANSSAQNPDSAQTATPLKTHPDVLLLINSSVKEMDAGHYDQALDLLKQARDKARALMDKTDEAGTLRLIGVFYYKRRELQKALEYFNLALPLYRELGNKRGEATLLTHIGTVYTGMAQPEKALEYFNQALPLHRVMENRQAEAAILIDIGNVYAGIEQPEKALGYFKLAQSICRELGNKRGEAVAIANIGVLYNQRRELQKALEYLSQALTLDREIKNKQAESNTLNNIGAVYQALGQLQKALEYFHQALSLYREIGDKQATQSILSNIGCAYLALEEPHKAIDCLNQALLLCREKKDKHGEAFILTYQGNAYYSLKQSQKALDFLNQALLLQRELGDRQGEAVTLGKIGYLYLNLKQPEKAFAYYKQALPIHHALGDKTGEANVLANMGVIYTDRNDLSKAQTYYQQAFQLIEQVRAQLGNMTDNKISFLEGYDVLYRSYLDVLLQRGKNSEVFELTQKMKARALLDILQNGKVDFIARLSDDEREQLTNLRKQSDALNAQLIQLSARNAVGDKAKFQQTQQELKKAESQLQALQDILYSRHPELSKIRQATTITFPQAAQALPSDTALLEYLTLQTHDADRVALLVLTRSEGKSVLHAYTLPAKASLLTQQVSAFHKVCADPTKPYRKEALALYKNLLAPAEKQLQGIRHLIVCPDGVLWNVPFQALLSPDNRFVEQRFTLSYAQNATAWQTALKAHPAVKPVKELLVVANPAFGNNDRFTNNFLLPIFRPINAPSRPINDPSRPINDPSRPINDPSRPINDPSRPINDPSRPINGPSRPINDPSRPINDPSRPINDPSRPINDPSRPLEAPNRELVTLVNSRGGILPLPGTLAEADALKRIFPHATLLLGAQAQEITIKTDAPHFKWLHFATHAFINNAAPLLSNLLLAQPDKDSVEDGLLTARELFDMQLNAEMVVLSACNTARGEQHAGEGVMGLTWVLTASGVPTQVVTQWGVNDASTSILMERFYANLKQGKSKSVALKEASESLREMKGKYQHPHYWAPFLIVGKP